MNEERAELAKALAEAQAEFPAIPKGRTANLQLKSGGSYSYNYADLADIFTAIRKPLQKHGLSVSQTFDNGDGCTYLVTTLLHAEGGSLGGKMPVPWDGNPQQIGSAITYMRRYALCAILGIVAEEDDDGAGAKAAHESRPAPKPRSSAKGRTISEKQAGRLWAITYKQAGELGISKEEAQQAVREHLVKMGFESTSELDPQSYDKLVSIVEGWTEQTFGASPPDDGGPF